MPNSEMNEIGTGSLRKCTLIGRKQGICQVMIGQLHGGLKIRLGIAEVWEHRDGNFIGCVVGKWT